jgi:hypothetical protein
VADIDTLSEVARAEMGASDAEVAVMKALHESDYGDLIGPAFLPAVARVAVAAVRAADQKPKAVRLTPPQVELLTDIATTPQMYITRWTRWDKTAQALIDKGLAARTPGHAGGHQYGIAITDAGRAEAARRGIGQRAGDTGSKPGDAS